MKAGVILNLNGDNMYSFAALVGALEMDERLNDVDFRLVRDPMKHIEKMLKQYERVISCYSFMSSQGIDVFYEIRRLRSFFDKKIFLIGGGAHATGSPKDALKMGFDVVVVGEGEKTLPELIYRIVKDYLTKVTLLEKKSPHILRHTYATHLLNKGADLNAVKELLGHASLAATEIYTHTTFEKLHSIYQQAHPRG